MKYINTYNTESAYNSDSTRLYPNVSYVKATNEVKWMRNNPSPEPGPTPTPTPTDNLSAKYTTTSANETVQIVWSQQSFSGITIDGLQPLANMRLYSSWLITVRLSQSHSVIAMQ